MIYEMNVINENGDLIRINIILRFRIEEINREYIAYTINDDHKSENVAVFISQIEEVDDEYRICPIKETEKNIVLTFYDYVRDSITGAK